MDPTITFIGEHLLPGNLGKFFVALSLTSSILAALAYFLSTRTEGSDKSKWIKTGRITFLVHAASVAGIFITLFYIIHSHYFEYAYAWQHSSLELPVHYMISCFWEGQEGSFLLWMFWHAVLGIFLFRSGKWEAPVMVVVALAQIVLGSMILGIEWLPGIKLGSSPFELLRIAKPELMDIPILESVGKANYLKVIVNGNGLNPLLQNYWMVIHPPTLFLGFAASIVPFAFVIAAMWLRDYKGWIAPALPWTLFCVMVLGAGIIMGGFWAYESLSFGGYWAWDPVENASLIPWLVIIAAVHVMLIQKSTGNYQILSLILAGSSFILVLYATFLTRSGILGDTSVHSFTDLGLSGQLMVFVFMFLGLMTAVSFQHSRARYIYALSLLTLLLINVGAGTFLKIPNLIYFTVSIIWMTMNLYRNIPLSEKEENMWSREFWMFIGTLILLLSAFQVLVNTSIPVLNKITTAFAFVLEPLANLTGWDKLKDIAAGKAAPPTNVVEFYNRWQLPIAILIALLSAIGQYFKYRKSDPKKVLPLLGYTLIAAIVLTIGGIWLFQINAPLLIGLMLAAFYAMVANAFYVYKVLKGNLKVSGGAVAHIGLGMMLIGILVSGSKQHVISLNYVHSYGESFDEKTTRENLFLQNGVPVQMGDYQITYRGDSTEGPNTFYRVDYLNQKNGEAFSLYPNAQFNERQGLMPNPDTRHFISKDIFTHVTSVRRKDQAEEWQDAGTHDIKPGDTLVINKNVVIFKELRETNGEDISNDLKGHRLTIGFFDVIRGDSFWQMKPVYGKTLVDDYTIFTREENAGLQLTMRKKISGEGIVLEAKQKEVIPDYIIMKAIVFPWINLLWAGTLIMLTGFVLSIRQRMKQKAQVHV